VEHSTNGSPISLRGRIGIQKSVNQRRACFRSYERSPPHVGQKKVPCSIVLNRTLKPQTRRNMGKS
jgi:hypothetical protein